ncbi:hypothetical protein BJY04DRAFT_197678 [Aspergillus karnatakaensis]|uniref:uncharacterized protein n=1 Tax=Aspergillus karnatakaensis TaxID=1810916 RepID=UPI003CCD32F9
MKYTTLLPTILLSATTLVSASPCAPDYTTVTAAQIEAIAPKSASCENPEEIAPEECATAAQAAPAFSAAFKKYKLTSKEEQAAVISISAFESGEFRFSRNHFPGVEGQGTRNMQSPAFNKLYAASIPALSERFEEVQDEPGAVLELLLEDLSVDFGSSSWFLTTQCEESIREGLKKDGEKGWEAFIVDCVGTEANEERKGYWVAAKKALGI